MMTGILVSGMLGLAPQILKTVETFARASNPVSTSMGKYEFAVARGTYDHLCKKIKYMIQFLKLQVEIPEIQLTDIECIDREAMHKFVRMVKYVLEQYDRYLSNDVLPKYCMYYFDSLVHDERSMNNLNLDLRLREFDESQIDASILNDELRDFEPYIMNLGIGISQDRFILVDKLISDSLLALSRIHPSRLISATDKFVILPRSAPKWVITENTLSDIMVESSDTGDVKLTLIWTDELKKKLSPYNELYNFDIYVRVDHSKSVGWYYKGENHHEVYSTAKYEPNNNTIVIQNLKYNDVKEHIQFFVKIIGKPNLEKLTGDKVASLHKIPYDNFVFGSLFTKGNYDIDDPIFSIDSIINNIIGSSQFSLQTSLSLCKAWQISLSKLSNDKTSLIHHRYITQFDGMDILYLSAIGSHIISTQMFRGKSELALENLWTRVLLDLEFMRKYIFRTYNGRQLVSALL